MIKCNYCEIEKDQTHFRRFKKDPLCFDCFNEENRKKRKSLNPKDSCIVCGVSKDLSNFVEGKNCCKSCKKKYMSEYYENNKDSWVEYLKKSSNSENFKEKQKEYADKNKDKIKEYQKEYRIKNKENIKQKRKKYNKIRALRHKERYETDIDYRVRKIHRNILKSFMKRMKMGPKKDHTSKLLGYSYFEFKSHIESLFSEGMNWFNHGEWHIDHIRPVSSFEIDTDPSVVNALDNLQPLWAIDNMKKSDKYAF